MMQTMSSMLLSSLWPSQRPTPLSLLPLLSCYQFLDYIGKPHPNSKAGKKKASGAGASPAIESAGNASLVSSHSSIQLADSQWNSDSGATSHMTHHLEWLSNCVPCRVAIRVANGEIVHSEWMGEVRWQPVIDGQLSRQVVLMLK